MSPGPGGLVPAREPAVGSRSRNRDSRLRVARGRRHGSGAPHVHDVPLGL